MYNESRKLKDIENAKQIQGDYGNWNYNEYMLGYYNGMELIHSILQDRSPKFRTIEHVQNWGGWVEEEEYYGECDECGECGECDECDVEEFIEFIIEEEEEGNDDLIMPTPAGHVLPEEIHPLREITIYYAYAHHHLKY